jgi:hypothetical protein
MRTSQISLLACLYRSLGMPRSLAELYMLILVHQFAEVWFQVSLEIHLHGL